MLTRKRSESDGHQFKSEGKQTVGRILISRKNLIIHIVILDLISKFIITKELSMI